jgi:hypothetical protein
LMVIAVMIRHIWRKSDTCTVRRYGVGNPTYFCGVSGNSQRAVLGEGYYNNYVIAKSMQPCDRNWST